MSCFDLMGLLTVVLTAIEASPVSHQGPWVNPCDGSSPASVSITVFSTTTTTTPVIQSIQLLKVMSETATSVTDELIFLIKEEATFPPSIVVGLDNEPKLPGFPDSNTTIGNTVNISTILKENNDRLSKIGVFLEKAREESFNYVTKIRELENKYVEMLCRMHNIFDDISESIPSPLDRFPVVDFSDAAKIHSRNYLIGRDSRKVFVQFEIDLETYINSIQSGTS